MAICETGRLGQHYRGKDEEVLTTMSGEQGYANPAALVSTQWVADHLNDPNVRLIEVDVDTAAYGTGHVQGAVGVNWTTQLGDPIRRDIPNKDAWGKRLSDAGVSADTRIIFYGDNKKWELENRPLTTDAPRQSATRYSAKEPDLKYRAFLRDVLDRPSATALVDV